MFNELLNYVNKPKLYDSSTKPFWDDEHISKGMLEAHLNPNWDAATRKHKFITQSVNWISIICPPSQCTALLDLGCGPGLYAERFHSAGYDVTGVDFSKRSIAYAKEQAKLNQSSIDYFYQNYLTIDYTEQFDVITLIYCDYAVLSIEDRRILLKNIYQALKPNGKFIFDVFSSHMRKEESHSWHYCENGGFYSKKPYICLESCYQYNDEDKTELDQYIIMAQDGIECYNVWNHYFTTQSLMSEILPIGFKSYEFYGDVAGKDFSDTEETICGVFTK